MCSEIYEEISKKSMKYLIVPLLIFTMVLIPYTIEGNAPLYITAIALMAVLGVCFKIPGFEFLLIAIVLCIPSGWDGTSGLVFPEVDNMTGALGRFNQYLIPAVGYYLLLNNSFNKKKTILFLTFGVLFVGLIQLVLTYETKDIRMILNIIGCSYAFMLICLFDKKCDLKDAFLYIDVLFIMSLMYGILEYVFRQSPYQYITDATTSITEIGRARGILGHPLYLSGLALIYQSIIYVRYILLNKFGYVQELLCVIMALIVVSRTTIVVMVLEYILFVVLTKGYRSVKFWIANFVVLLIGSILILKFADSIVIDIFTRFVEGNVDHREGAFETVYLLFLDNPFGVGYSNIMDTIWKGGYAASGFESDFSTVDNLFLSQLAAYGIFSLVKIFYYFYFLFDSYKLRKKYPLLFKSILFLYFPFLLESFSFDWDISSFLCMILYGFIGCVYKDNYIGNTAKCK